MFTHFGKAADDWCNSDAFAFMALCRNMAISCREGMQFADLCIPIHFGNDTPLSRNATSAIFVSIKDKEKAMGYNRTYIDVNKMNFFTEGDKGRPVINLILQLGIQAAGRYIPIERTQNQKEPGLFVTPERKVVVVWKYHQHLLACPCCGQGIQMSPRHNQRVRYLDLLTIPSMRDAAAR
jgi:hypothetical protein